MIGNLLFLFQAFAVLAVVARPNDVKRSILEELFQNDPNLNPGFDIDAFRINQLNTHNNYRQKHNVPPMTLDSALTQDAQSYAEDLASRDNGLIHCANVANCSTDGAGENLAMAYGSTTVETNATKGWYEEIWDYDFCSTNVALTRPGHGGKAVGHFTQVVWKTSTLLGIGYARTSSRTKVFVVARYKQHGNINTPPGGLSYQTNVPKPSDISTTYQDNCNGVNGSYTSWSNDGTCSRSCGGGVIFDKRTCTNPKPSLNGRDCVGPTKQLAAQQWCNSESCDGDKKHRDLQCEARGYTPNSHNFGGSSDCSLHCHQSGNTFLKVGTVDDGTHCNSGSGVCLAGECLSMPQYVPITEPPPTDATGQLTGSYTSGLSSSWWENKIWTIPNGATNVVITNSNRNAVTMYAGYQSGNWLGYTYSDAWFFQDNNNYNFVVKGVSVVGRRTGDVSKFTIAGPVQPDTGNSLVVFAVGAGPVDISWSYTA